MLAMQVKILSRINAVKSGLTINIHHYFCLPLLATKQGTENENGNKGVNESMNKNEDKGGEIRNMNGIYIYVRGGRERGGGG